MRTQVTAFLGLRLLAISFAALPALASAAAPTALLYSANPVIYTNRFPIANNTPSNSGGAITAYSVNPALPSGLSISATTGIISGTPQKIYPIASYTVTGSNSSGSTTAALSITVANVTIAVSSGNNQNGTVGTTLSNPLIAVVNDANGKPVNGAPITWAVTGGSGTLSNASSVTAGTGIASATFTLASTPGANAVSATITGSPFVANFTETGNAAPTPTPSPSPSPHGWTQVNLSGSAFATMTGINQTFAAPDGNLYLGQNSTIQRTSLYNPGASWIDMSAGIPVNWTVTGLGMLSNGTLVGVFGNRYSTPAVYGNIYYWNGSNWVFSVATGSTSAVYNFTQDSSGVTWFATAWNGDMWSNGIPGSTTFTKVYSNVYNIWSNGSQGEGVNPNWGGVYQFKIFDLGSGPMFLSGGEGDLNISTPSFSSNTSFLNSSNTGFRGNLTNIEKSPNYLIVTRGNYNNGDEINRYGLNPSLPGYHQFVDVSTTAGGYPGYVDTNIIGTLKFVSGTTWEWGTFSTSTRTTTLYRSTDDGATWHPDNSGLSSACTAGVSPGLTVSSSGQLFISCTPSGAKVQVWVSVP